MSVFQIGGSPSPSLLRAWSGVFILGIASSNAADQSNTCTCNHISQFNGLLSFMGCSFVTKERPMNNLNNADIDVLMLQNFEFNWFLHYGRFFFLRFR